MKYSQELIDQAYFYRDNELLEADKLNVSWHDPFDEAKFFISGSSVKDEHHFYRLYNHELDSIRLISRDVSYLATHSSGIQIHFKTNSRIVKLRVINTEPYEMKNMTFMASSGFDSYYRNVGEKEWKFNTATFPNFIDTKKWIGYAAAFVDKKDREIILNFPLYNGVFLLEIGVEEGCYVTKNNFFNTDKKILIYGTSIIQGASSPRPGVSVANTVSRYFNQEVINFGFSGAALMEKEVAELISKRDNIEMIIIDAEPNAGVAGTLPNNIEDFLTIITKKFSDVPIALLTKIKCSEDDYNPRTRRIHEFCEKVILDNYQEFKDKGYRMYYFDNYNLLDSHCTIEGLHPTHIGMDLLSKSYIEIIKYIKKHEN